MPWNMDDESRNEPEELEDEVPTTPVYVQQYRWFSRPKLAFVMSGIGSTKKLGETKDLLEYTYHLTPTEFDQWSQAKEARTRNPFAKFDKPGRSAA